MPSSTAKIFDILNIVDKDRKIENINKENSLNHDMELKKISILFKKIENDN